MTLSATNLICVFNQPVYGVQRQADVRIFSYAQAARLTPVRQRDK